VNTAASEARAYFAGLWQDQAPAWRAGRVRPLAMNGRRCVPLDYCVTTIARLRDQNRPAPELDAAVAELAVAVPGQFVYAGDQRHITLVGCTPRHAKPGAVPVERIGRIERAVASVLAEATPAVFDLEGVGILGAQVFAQVVPRDCRWRGWRARLIDALVEMGETPQTHPSAAPIHLNVLRLTEASADVVSTLLTAIERMRVRPLGTLIVSRVALVETDFVVTPELTTDFAAFALDRAG
jgi:hypothetical protein